MTLLVVCTGTGTDVGKTWVGARVLSSLRAEGASVAARKPVQSYDPGDGAPTDAELLALATGEAAAAVCPRHRWYPLAQAPPMAAEALGRDAFGIADLVAELGWPDAGAGSGRPAVRWVESAGGVRSPLAADGDTVDLCAALEPHLVVVVARPGLGTINEVRLSVGALAGPRVVVVLNRYDPTDDLHRRNLEWLRERCHLEVLTAARDLAGLLAGGVDRR